MTEAPQPEVEPSGNVEPAPPPVGPTVTDPPEDDDPDTLGSVDEALADDDPAGTPNPYADGEPVQQEDYS